MTSFIFDTFFFFDAFTDLMALIVFCVSICIRLHFVLV